MHTSILLKHYSLLLHWQVALDWKEDDTMTAATPIIVCLHGMGRYTGIAFGIAFCIRIIQGGLSGRGL